MKAIHSLWRAVKDLLGAPAADASNSPRVEYSYTIFWTKQVRKWDADRRAAVSAALQAVLDQPGFEPNAYQRRYTVAGLDALAHSGASLLALKKVLAAFQDQDQ